MIFFIYFYLKNPPEILKMFYKMGKDSYPKTSSKHSEKASKPKKKDKTMNDSAKLTSDAKVEEKKLNDTQEEKNKNSSKKPENQKVIDPKYTESSVVEDEEVKKSSKVEVETKIVSKTAPENEETKTDKYN